MLKLCHHKASPQLYNDSELVLEKPKEIDTHSHNQSKKNGGDETNQ